MRREQKSRKKRATRTIIAKKSDWNEHREKKSDLNKHRKKKATLAKIAKKSGSNKNREKRRSVTEQTSHFKSLFFAHRIFKWHFFNFLSHFYLFMSYSLYQTWERSTLKHHHD
jgi:hypothetical protein